MTYFVLPPVLKVCKINCTFFLLILLITFNEIFNYVNCIYRHLCFNLIIAVGDYVVVPCREGKSIQNEIDKVSKIIGSKVELKWVFAEGGEDIIKRSILAVLRGWNGADKLSEAVLRNIQKLKKK